MLDPFLINFSCVNVSFGQSLSNDVNCSFHYPIRRSTCCVVSVLPLQYIVALSKQARWRLVQRTIIFLARKNLNTAHKNIKKS